jgi:nicotinate-nucleotide pyrophosphorylase (carboxylating)
MALSMNAIQDLTPDPAEIDRILSEDLGPGDLTAAIIPAEATATATVLTREPMVLCGRAWFAAVFRRLDSSVAIDWRVEEGAFISPGTVLCSLHGPARALLTGERTALNLLQTLSGTATTARGYAEAVAGTGVRVLDTRKTLPGLRLAQKYAVRCGGCHNHRIGLYDGILIKENHILAAGSITKAVSTAKAMGAAVMIEVEVENLDELREALDAGAERILLDNFSLGMMREAVALARGRAELEVSGNVTLATIREFAETGVDYISVGALTKNLRAIDLSMRIVLGA